MSRAFSKILILVILIILAGGGIFAWQYFGVIEKVKDETAGWKTYRNEEHKYEVKYPERVMVSAKDNKLFMTHYILFEHPDPCDFMSGTAVRSKLVDFDIYISISDKSISQSMHDRGIPILLEYAYDPSSVQTVAGFIEKTTIGNLSGYLVIRGIEGCGQYDYFFYLAPEKTLLVTRNFITEFLPVITDYKKYLNLPGIIPPEEEEELFNQILSAFKFLE